MNGAGLGRSAAYPTALVFAASVAALYVGRDVFIPVALAILLSFMLAPITVWLQRRHVPRIAAVICTVSLAFVFIAAFSYTVATQVTQLAANLPGYQGNIETKIRELKTSDLSNGLISRVGSVLQRISDEIARSAEPGAQLENGPPKPTPLPVTIEEPPRSPLQIIEDILGPLLKPLATAGIVIVLVIFILLQRQDLRDRFIRLAGAGDLSRPTQAIEDAGTRVAQYLLAQLVVNVTYGIPIGVGLWWIGVPNPWLWGMLATVLRFVPYVGPIVAAMLPIALAFAVDPGWSMLVWTVLLFIVIELVSNNFIEPWLYGARTGLSAFAIIVAAIFWTWLWGPVGLLLSTPLTVCLVVLGRHVPLFASLDVLLGSEPVLTPVERLTQRLLAGDPDESTEVADIYRAEHPLATFYDAVAFPALVSIERDRALGLIDADRRKLAAETMVTVIDNLSEHDDDPATEMAAAPSPRSDARPVLCLGGRGSLDDAASAILAQLLERHGVNAMATSLAELSTEGSLAFNARGLGLVCISYLDRQSAIRARYLVRRLRRRQFTVPLVVGFWANGLDAEAKAALAKSTGADHVESSLAAAVDLAVGLAGEMPGGAGEPVRLVPAAATG